MKLTNLTGDEIKALRNKHKLSTKECAEVCGISQRAWQGYEAGKPMRQIYIETLQIFKK
jgi:transcriptional regulator with XRE-family HTH domain